MYSNIFDSHAHYDSEQFSHDIQAVLTQLPNDGVRYIMNIGCNKQSNLDTIALTEKYKYIYGSVGIHPDDANSVTDEYIDILENLSKHDKIKAIGEIGLDYHYETIPRDKQILAFEKQLILSKELDLPVIVHDRDAHEDTLNLLKKYNPKGIVHCYSGSAEMAEEIIKLGMYIGFTGVLTFKNAKKAVKACQSIPIRRLLLETDCPYMAPEPYRGKRCDSSMIAKTAEKLAEIKNLPVQQVLDITCENARTVYNI